MNNCRDWFFFKDMNYDGAVTISDIWLWVKWAYFYLGDLFLYGVNQVLPEVARFFELSCDNYGGWISGVISPLLFLFITIILMLLGTWALILLITPKEAFRLLFKKGSNDE